MMSPSSAAIVSLDASSSQPGIASPGCGGVHTGPFAAGGRTLLLERIRRADARCRAEGANYAVLLLAVDRFHLLGAGLGHDAREAVMEAISTRIRAVTRAGDTLGRAGDTLLRVDGDTLVLLVEDVALAATLVAERILRVLGEPVLAAPVAVLPSVSVGIALPSPADLEPEAILRRAAAAMLHARGDGGARYAVYDTAVHGPPAGRLEMEADLRRALANGEFRVHYQPLVDLATGRITAAEALVRWEHPARGLVSPCAFIPVAEDIGLIGELGGWVLRESCAQLARWRQAVSGGGVRSVSVNISVLQLARGDLVAEVQAALEAGGLPPDSLQLEITESRLLEEAPDGQRVLQALQALGVRIVLDDFGTGYANLASLHALPVDGLKVERRLVTGIAADPRRQRLIAGIVGLARCFGLGIVAEGVSDPADLRAVRALGFDQAQGYLFSPAVHAEDLAELMAADPTW